MIFRFKDDKDLVIQRLEDELKKAVKLLNKEKDRGDGLKEELELYKSLFTKGQQKRIKNKKRTTWTSEDISKAMTMYSSGPKLYKLLRKKKFPLPSRSTLNRHACKINIQPGFLEPVLSTIAKNADNGLAKYCTISLDEVKTGRSYEYDESRKRVLRPTDYALLFMVKGLCVNWQQVVYYNFDKTPTKELVDMVISKVEGCGLHPCALVSDMGTKNTGMWNELNIKFDGDPFFKSAGGKKIFVFADTPHLLKNLRNHFLDTGLLLKDGYVGTDPIRRLISIQTGDIKIAHKVSLKHFPKEKTVQRQNVKLAAQLFSNSVAGALKRLDSLSKTNPESYSKMPQETQGTAEFIQKINDWFDIFNTTRPIMDSRPTKKAFGYHDAFSKQSEILLDVLDTVREMRVPGNDDLLPFQKGIIQNIRGLFMLLDYLKEVSNGEIKYIMTDRINQDCLERFFGYLRSKGGGMNDHPTPLQLKYRLRSSILGQFIEFKVIVHVLIPIYLN